MTNSTTSFRVSASPLEAYNAISNVRGWWSENVSDTAGGFDYHYRDVHRCSMKIIGRPDGSALHARRADAVICVLYGL